MLLPFDDERVIVTGNHPKPHTPDDAERFYQETYVQKQRAYAERMVAGINECIELSHRSGNRHVHYKLEHYPDDHTLERLKELYSLWDITVIESCGDYYLTLTAKGRR